ncbi:hypothetical protein M758_4G061400 [Ceratodon purpureus]|nr:hypothetical protein M758_4G061400 [Ceratodon purpureus]
MPRVRKSRAKHKTAPIEILESGVTLTKGLQGLGRPPLVEIGVANIPMPKAATGAEIACQADQGPRGNPREGGGVTEGVEVPQGEGAQGQEQVCLGQHHVPLVLQSERNLQRSAKAGPNTG